MKIVRDRPAIDAIADPELRQLIQQSADPLLSQFDPGEYTLEELCYFIGVEPSSSKFVKKPDLPEVRKQLKNYERMKLLIDRWIDLATELSTLRLNKNAD